MKLLHTIHIFVFSFLITHSLTSAQPNDFSKENDQNNLVTAGYGVGSCLLVMAAGGLDTAKHYFRQNNYPRSEKLCGYASHVCLGTGIFLFFGTLYRVVDLPDQLKKN
ncbi:hypothetical protein HYX58_04865 [Candidatus Dependentiae bacterium]|nr:hypothetical protein [Candidatus Dependentiae bacterium]